MRANISTAGGLWRRSHYLNRMSMKELVVAYFQHPAVLVYLALALVSMAIATAYPISPLRLVAAVVAAAVLYPLAWYGIHRFILHGRWMWRSRALAGTWKRIHYDHHQDPNHMEVLFGAIQHTLPAVAISTAVAGWFIGGVGGAAVAFAAGLITTCAYEFVHCIQHLGVKPKNRWLAELKRRHMEHHFHDENGNYGIMSFLPDKVFGTAYERQQRRERSPHVFNLGYTPEVAARYPYVAELSGGVVTSHPRQRIPAE